MVCGPGRHHEVVIIFCTAYSARGVLPAQRKCFALNAGGLCYGMRKGGGGGDPREVSASLLPSCGKDMLNADEQFGESFCGLSEVKAHRLPSRNVDKHCSDSGLALSSSTVNIAADACIVVPNDLHEHEQNQMAE